MKIVWSDPAVADLDAIWEHIARDSPHYARRVVYRLIEAVEPLADFPQMGRQVPEAEGRGLRELIESGYRIIYATSGERIAILTVVHSSRDLSRLLER